MTLGERTRQQLDPSNTLGSRRGAMVLSAVALLWSIGVVMVGSMTRASAPLELVGLLFLVLAGIVMVRACDPLRAPFSRGSHAVVHSLLLAGFVSSTVAVWDAPAVFGEAWAPAAVGLFAVAMSPYRPARELVVAASLSALVIGLVSLGRSVGTDGSPAFAVVILSVLPTLAFSFGSARYTQCTIESIERRRRRSDLFYAGLADELSHSIGRSVQRDRAVILGREATPFLRDILSRSVVTGADRVRARSIAQAVRGVMVAEADLSWVEAAVLSSPPAGGGAHTVHDPDAVVSGMDHRQRAALRSLIVAASGPMVSAPITFEFGRDGSRCSAIVTLGADATSGSLQPELDPYLAVMAAVFQSFSVQSIRPTLIVRFSFDHN